MPIDNPAHLDRLGLRVNYSGGRVRVVLDSVELWLPALPSWMPDAMGVGNIAQIHFQPATHSASIRTEPAGDWQRMSPHQQDVLACWVRRAVRALATVPMHDRECVAC